MSSSVRDLVRTMLQPLITGKRWSVKPHTVRQVLTLDRPTVYIEHTVVNVLVAAPIGSVENTVVVTILDHHTDYDKAEDALDVAVLDLILDLDSHERLAWTKAEKVEVADKYLGWAITLTVITEKES